MTPGAVQRDDLFPAFCIPTDWAPGLLDEWFGVWFGDVVEATNDRPETGYEDLTGLKLDGSMPTCLGDEEILAYVCDDAPDPSADWRAWRAYANCRLRALLGKTGEANHGT